MSNLNDTVLVVSRLMEKDVLKGFLVVDFRGESIAIPVEVLQNKQPTFEIQNAKYDTQFKTLVGTHGQSLTDCPSINASYELTSRNGISIFCIVNDIDTGKPVGVVAYNGLGARFNLTFAKLDELSRKNKCCNFELYVDPKFGLYCRRKDGSAFDTIALKSRQKIAKVAGGCIKQVNNEEVPMIGTYDMQEVVNSEFNSSCQDKLVKAALFMQKLTPYYFTLYSTIPRKPAPIETMGVTEDTLYYSQKFVAQMQVEELVFVLIHEILHIMMQHSLRFKPRTNHDLWNVACDLYINTIICNDFGCTHGGGVHKVMLDNGTEVGIKTPDFGVFEDTFNKKLDFKYDTPETIYAEMLKDNQQNQQGQGGQSGQGQNQQGQGQQSQSQQGQGSQSQGQQGQNGQSQGQKQADQGNGQGQGQGQGSDTFDDGAGDGSDGQTQTKTVSVTYNGKTTNVTVNKDIMTNNNSNGQESEKSNLDASRKALQRAKTKVAMEEEEQGGELVKNAGQGGSLVQRYIEIGLASGVDWRVLLKNLCKDKPKKTFTLAQPNTDYMNMGMTIADRRAIGKPTHISHVKFAIDVSGSVSKKELDAALSEINAIYKHFKLDGELIYWSTMIGNAGNFSNLKDMMKIEPISDGGTDCRCVFDYLACKTKVHGRYESDKPKDITAIFIITDGCFSNNFSEYAQMFGKKVVWLVTGVKGNLVSFNPPFGRAIPLSLD